MSLTKALTPGQQTVPEFQAPINRLELEKEFLKGANTILIVKEQGSRR